MFTGIIEEIGTVKEFSMVGQNALIVVTCEDILTENYPSPQPSPARGEGVNIGDSIAINGVCQTVIKLDKNSFSAQVSAETLSVTNFSKLKKDDKVNLERALTLNKRLGGHIVQGHIDGIAKLKYVEQLSDFYNLKFEVAKELTNQLVKKGSVTINGISLTLADVTNSEISIAVIPHTFENTTLKYLKTGDFVNLEVDILAKYVEKFLSRDNNKTIDENFLKENGFF